jgi:hypothetical protein
MHANVCMFAVYICCCCCCLTSTESTSVCDGTVVVLLLLLLLLVARCASTLRHQLRWQPHTDHPTSSRCGMSE